jgi:hypothetical protein
MENAVSIKQGIHDESVNAIRRVHEVFHQNLYNFHNLFSYRLAGAAALFIKALPSHFFL